MLTKRFLFLHFTFRFLLILDPKVINQHREDAMRDTSVYITTSSVAERPSCVLMHTCRCFFLLLHEQLADGRHSDGEKQRGRTAQRSGGKQRVGLTGQTLHPLGRFLTFLHFPDHCRTEAAPKGPPFRLGTPRTGGDARSEKQTSGKTSFIAGTKETNPLHPMQLASVCLRGAPLRNGPATRGRWNN